jgi:hypothetical protein
MPVPDYLRKAWADAEDDHDYEPWVLPDFRAHLGKAKKSDANKIAG